MSEWCLVVEGWDEQPRDRKGRRRLTWGRRTGRAEVVKEYEQSGLTQAQFARRSGLVCTTFAHWVQRSRRVRAMAPDEQHLRLDPFEGLDRYRALLLNATKFLHWDGVWVLAKRLEWGRFSRPPVGGGLIAGVVGGGGWAAVRVQIEKASPPWSSSSKN